MILDKRTFEGGMNSDDDPRALPAGDYRKAINFRIGTVEGENTFSVEKIKGNTLVNYTLPGGTNKCLGSYDDETNKKVYYFVYNSTARHLVLEYNYAVGAIALVLQNSVLNFSSGNPITHINVLEGALSWTDYPNYPREMDIAKAKAHSAGDFVNGYASPFTEEFLKSIKYAPECQPACSYADDATKNKNFLTQKLFQFKYRYWYFNHQSSTWSAISTVPLPAIVCGNTSINAAKNCLINVTVETGSPIVTRIEIAMREGNLGDFSSIVDLDKAKLNISSGGTYVYPFYNEKVYSIVNIKESILLFDSIWPSKCQEIAENRKIYANMLEGYDPVAIEAKLSLAYQQDISTVTYGVTGRIYIKNALANNTDAAYNQPIYNDGQYLWGGASGVNIFPFVSGVDTYQQTIPMGGFPVYLAGTPYKAVSRQAPPAASTPGVQDAVGVYVAGTSSEKNKIRNEMQISNCFSTFTISGIPPGDYVLRLASHQLTQPEFDAPGRSYELTSTNVAQCAGYQDTEARIHIAQNGTATVNGIAAPVVNNVVQLMETHIIDLTDPSAGASSTALTGYATDCDVQPTPTTYAGFLADTRIERASVQFINASTLNYNGVQANYTWLAEWPGTNASFTDHNGYFFFTCNNLLSGSVTVNSLASGIGVTPSNYNTSGGAFSGVSGSQGAQIVSRAPGASSPFNDWRTTVSGTVIDSNSNPIEGAAVVIGHSRVETTDNNGQWEVIIYGNMFNFWNSPAGINQRQEYINYSLSDGCIGVFAGSPDYLSIAFSPFATGQTIFTSAYGGNYNYTYGLAVTSQVVTIVGGGASTKGWKRGGVYQEGLVYYNIANQSGLVNTTDGLFSSLVTANGYGMRMEIPFYTEGSPIVGQLIPIVSWQIFSLPPVWATHYQWVRTLNSAMNGYLQFVAKQVITALDDRSVSLQNFQDATKLGFDISNIINYNSTYTDSVGNVTYDFTKGDRIRMIRDGAGNFYQQYFDFPIRDFVNGIVYIDYVVALGQPVAGCEFEIYTPKKKADQEVYYEFGECYEVGNPGASNRYHKGQTQDQDPSNPITVPARGTFTEGDTYYRTRNMLFLNSSNQSSYANRIVEADTFSDFFPSKVQDMGRPNRVDNQYRQILRPTTVWHSEIFVPETFINGQNRFYDLSFESYDRAFKSIQRIYTDNHVLEVYQELKCGEIPINQRYLYNAGGDNQLVTTDSFFNDIVYSTGNWGIGQNPESFAVNGNSKYFIDLPRGVSIRKNIDGLTPISEHKMHNYFTTKSQLYQQRGVSPKIYGVFDRRFDEYILCFEVATNNAVDPPVTIPAETIAFNEKRNRWVTYYSYDPENIGQAGMDIISFKNGGLYLHNSNSARATFYGVFGAPELWVVSNTDPSKVKVFLTCSQEASDVMEVYDATTPAGQSTNLLTTDFQLLEGIYYADFLRDGNTPNVTDPVINGDPMRGTSLLAKFRSTTNTPLVIFAMNIGVIASERSNR